jgi:hypothetical protein
MVVTGDEAKVEKTMLQYSVCFWLLLAHSIFYNDIATISVITFIFNTIRDFGSSIPEDGHA